MAKREHRGAGAGAATRCVIITLYTAVPSCRCFPDCLTGPENGPATEGCDVFYFDPDDDVDLPDFAAFQEVFTG